jgi:protein involved in polysaccharide export with SLBB domain
LVDLSNGLTQEAKGDAAYVFRTYPNGKTEVLPVVLDDTSFKFMDGDELRILSEKTFFDGAVISVSGEVKIPLEMPYDGSITLAEVVELAGGLTFAGDSTQLIVYRMPFSGTSIGEMEEISLDLSRDGNYVFQPYDALVVRRKYGFEFQEYVELSGEVVYPGRYAIRKGETIKDLLRKAGGLTSTAFPEAALFTRQGKGEISISIDKILKNKGAYDNIQLLPGDKINIPSLDYTVEIRMANTEAENYGLFSDRYSGESMHVAYVSGKNAKWYVKNMAGGWGENAKRTNTSVIYANGVARDYKFFKGHAKVKPGATIVVAAKAEKEAKKERKDVDWQAFSQNIIAQATSVLTVWTLATRL